MKLRGRDPLVPAESSRTKAESSNAALKGPLSTNITAGKKSRGGFVNKLYKVQRVTLTEAPKEQNRSQLS